MKLPDNRELFETDIATYWFDDKGILNSVSKSPTRTVENTSASFELVRKISKGEKVCLLVFLTRSGMPDKQTREYVRTQLPTVYKAMAMISDSGVGELIMNVLFRLKPPAIPMRSFRTEEAARKWLEQYL